MPLPPAAPRRPLHTRQVEIVGYRRDDGLTEIEARMIDFKHQDYPIKTGVRRPGEAVHDMWLRITFDDAMRVHDLVALTDAMPYPGACNQINDAYRKLIGISLAFGFRKAVMDAVGGIQGCSHLTELLLYLPTAAFQTLATEMPEDDGVNRPFQLDRCHALETHGETVRLHYPKWFRAPAAEAEVDGTA